MSESCDEGSNQPVSAAPAAGDATDALNTWLREAEPTLRALSENARGGILVVQTGCGRLVMANTDFCRMLGYSEAELRGMTPQQLHPAAVWPYARELYRDMPLGERDQVYELPFLTKSGGIVYADVNPSYVTIKGETCFLGVFQNAMARRQARESLARSEALLAEAQSLAHLGNWNLDLVTGLATWSDEEYRLLGYEPGAVPASGEIFMQAVHPDDRDAVMAEMQRVMDPDEMRPYHIEHRVLLPVGERILEQRGRVIFDETGRPLRMYGTSQDVTEQKRVQMQLREERNFSSAVLDSAGAIVLVLDRDGRIRRFNRACQALTGYTFAEVEGRCPWDFLLLPEESHDVREGAFKTLIDNPGARPLIYLTYTNHWLDKAGGRHLIEWHNTPLLDSQGRVEYLVSIGIDVTEKRRVEAALLRSEETYARAEAIAHIGSWDWNIVGGGLRWTDEIFRIFGLSPQSFGATYQAFLDAIHPNDRQKVIAAVNASVADDSVPYSVEHRVLRPDGTVRFVHERGKVYRDEQGAPLRMIGSVHDITERKQGELELELYRAHLEDLVSARTAALMESERLLRNAQAIAHLGHWSVNLQTDTVIWSDEVCRIFGYPPGSDFTPSQERFFAAVHPDDVEQVVRAKALAITKGEVLQLDHRIVLPDGGIRWVHEEAVSEFDAAGQALRLTGTVQDITARKQAEAEILRARDEAERANQAKSEFLSRMSHELRTPLNAILGFAQLLDRAGLPEEEADNVQEVLHAGRHLLELINEVLDLARIESGAFTVSKESVALSPLIAECLALIRPQAEARDIRIVDAAVADAHTVQADRTRLKQVLLNLLSNAVKYNLPAGCISVTSDTCDDRVQIRISDSGPGLSPAQQARLFTPFERLDADGSGIEGTGIGLALSKRLMEVMDGEIGVDSAPGEGSTFWLRLPAADDVANAVTPSTKASPAALLAGSQSRQDVLCIEDNPANLHLIERILAYRPAIRLLAAATPSLGLELARAHRPALILLDINLPEMDGYGVMECLRENATTCDIPVIAVSANAMPQDLARGQAAGFADYLTKPLEVDRFLAVLDAHLAAMKGESRV